MTDRNRAAQTRPSGTFAERRAARPPRAATNTRCCTGLTPCWGERTGGFVERHALSRLDEKKVDSFFIAP